MRLLLILATCLILANSHAEEALRGRMPEDLIPELQRVIDLALENSRILNERELLEDEAKGRQIAARSAVLPSFDANVAFRQERDQDTQVDSKFEDRVIYSIGITHPLYHWGSRKAEKQIGDLQYEMAMLETAKKRSEVVYRVRRDYMGLVVSKQKVDRSRKDLEKSQEALDFQLAQVEAGAESDVSVLPYRLNVERDEIAALRELNDYEYRLDELAEYASIDRILLESLIAEVIPGFEQPSEEQVQKLESYFMQGMERDEDLQRLDLDIEIDRRRLEIEDKVLRPKVDAQLGWNSNALDVDGVRREQAYAFFGLRVGWRIFDGYRKRGRTMEAINRLSRKEQSFSMSQDREMREYGRMLRKLEIERRSLDIEERTLKSVQGRLDWITDSVEAGSMPQSDLDRAQADFDKALLRAQSSRISYLLALSQIASELGLDPVEQRWDEEL